MPARAALLVALAVLLTTGLARSGPPGPGPSAPGAPASGAPGGTASEAPGGPADTFRSVRTYPAVAEPVRLRIPALGVDSDLQRLDRLADGTVAVPGRADRAGWFAQGPRPGQPGPAVVLGHVDSRTGPGVFFGLARIRPGAVVHVDRADASTIEFRVTEVSRVPKSRFPTDLVYGPTLEPTLRLVTCGGGFDESRRSYRDNVIVFATPA
ncbi:class F sortase [Actinoplanes sp. NPDC049668]|uniref:class F sortase n=1 Tax=unclassified Actinoplanes TaxID=2626549 RepID=UPI0033A4CA4B